MDKGKNRKVKVVSNEFKKWSKTKKEMEAVCISGSHCFDYRSDARIKCFTVLVIRNRDKGRYFIVSAFLKNAKGIKVAQCMIAFDMSEVLSQSIWRQLRKQ